MSTASRVRCWCTTSRHVRWSAKARPQSDLARETLKDPYRFDFLGVGSEAAERELEGALVEHITKFRLELGAGFAFVGRQVLLNVGGDDFFIDPKISKPTYRASNKLNAN